MDESAVISLIREQNSQDDIGQYISGEIKRTVFCKKRSISRAELFEAGRDGLKPSMMFKMFRYDYNGEKIVEFEGRRYGVYRTYEGENEQIEIYVEEKGGLNGKEKVHTGKS